MTDYTFLRLIAELPKEINLKVSLFLDGKFKLNKLTTHVYKLEDINKAFGELESGKTGRALIDMMINQKNK